MKSEMKLMSNAVCDKKMDGFHDVLLFDYQMCAAGIKNKVPEACEVTR